MYKPESVPENETQIILSDFEIQTSHLILTRRPDPVLIKKKKRIWHLESFGVSVGKNGNLKKAKI